MPPNVRRYYHAGTTHNGGGGRLQPRHGVRQSGRADASNPNPKTYINRALYVAMIEWLTMGRRAAAFGVPKISDGTLVAANSVAMGWPNIPNAPKPDGVINPVLDYDFGPLFRYNDGSGVITNARAADQAGHPDAGAEGQRGRQRHRGRAFAAAPPAARHLHRMEPDRAPGPLAGREGVARRAATSRSRGRGRERLASGDPRLSIEERYPNLWTYYSRAQIEASRMVRERMLLPEDASRQLSAS